MRLLVVTETYPPEINGVAMTTGRMVAGLRDRGHWVGLVRPRRHPTDVGNEAEWTVPGITLPNYPGIKLGLPVWHRLSRLMRTHFPDVVHVVTEGPLGWAAVLTARSLGLPVTSGYHTHFDQYSGHYGLRWLSPLVTHSLDALHRRCSATLVPAPELATTLAARGIPNVEVVGRGVDTTLYHPGRRSPSLRLAWGLEEQDLACLYVGRLAPEKNLELVARAFDAIFAIHPKARMIWVGDGPARVQLQENYPHHIFSGSRTGDELARHYASADLFIFGSLSETWGNVIAEAMASGLGVVAYARAAGAALIQHGRNGLTVLPGDSSAFVQAVLTLAQDEALRRELGDQAAKDMADNAWSGVIGQLESALARAIKAPA
ncbi:MAG: glycosyltransferase family 1 protein [Thiobacillus sp.]|nr:glycosyltransferase family 1 protein [Thiobacillus sp.]